MAPTVAEVGSATDPTSRNSCRWRQPIWTRPMRSNNQGR